MIKVADVARALFHRRRSTELSRLDELGPTERARVEEALAAMPPTASVDVTKLIEDQRRAAAERAAAQPQPDPTAAFQYFLTIADHAQLVELKRLLQRGMSVETAMAAVQGRPASPATTYTLDDDDLDDELDDEEADEEERPRRRVARYRPGMSQPEQVTAAPPKRERPSTAALCGRVLGADSPDRPLGCPDTVSDYEQWRQAG